MDLLRAYRLEVDIKYQVKLWYNEDMDIPSWLDKILSEPVAIATLVLALVTAVLAVAAFWSISQNNKSQKRERRERLLNELLEWAVDIEKSATNRRKPERDELWDARQKYLSSKAMSDYMKRVASCFTGLLDNLVDVITRLDETTSATDEALSVSSPSGKPNTENLVPKEKRLREQIVVLTQQIANIKTANMKTKDIA